MRAVPADNGGTIRGLLSPGATPARFDTDTVNDRLSYEQPLVGEGLDPP